MMRLTDLYRDPLERDSWISDRDTAIVSAVVCLYAWIFAWSVSVGHPPVEDLKPGIPLHPIASVHHEPPTVEDPCPT